MTAQKIIESVKLPTLSKTLFDIIEIEKKNPISFLTDIKRTVEKDPLLSAHVLKVANSPFYGFSQKVRTISHAIGLLGVRKIRTMAFSFSIFDFLRKIDYKPGFAKVFNLILKKTLLFSSISTILAKKTNYFNPEELYASGLMTEIGQLTLFLYAPEHYSGIYSVYDKKILEREREMFNTDHVEVGEKFCEMFQLPDFFKTAISSHVELKTDEEHCKISYIANQVTELLLTDDEEEKVNIFKEVENHTKKLLHLSLSELDETIKSLPEVLSAFIDDFPEVQKDLHKIVGAGSSLIISLMKREMDMVIKTRELTDSQKRLAKEKIFLSHMLNLSYFFSSLMEPLRIISSLFEYFDNFIDEFTIEFIYKDGSTQDFRRIRHKDEGEGVSIDIAEYRNLMKSKISNEPVRLENEELHMLEKSEDIICLVFPVSYHHNFFGFLLLEVEKEKYLSFDMEMSYVQILSNIIANSFQNYLSFDGMKKEATKKKMVTQELFKFDKELNNSRATVIELQKAEIMGELLPVIFHKLKNKLTPILGYSQILLGKVEEGPVLDRIKKIERNANELANQLNVLRDYFKSEKITKETSNINTIITHMKPYFDDLEKSKKIAVGMELDNTMEDSLLSPGQIEAMIARLVENGISAIEARGGENGRVEIRTETVDGGFKLEIKDNGVGIKEDLMGRMWAPFYSDFPGHAGIGLTVAEKVISNHQATYQVDTRVGEYTRFEITFPRGRAAGGEAEEGKQHARKDVHGRILIVDDEAYLADLMKEILLNEGNFEIVTAAGGKEALKIIESGFDLVILDIRMPGVDGMDVFDFLKARGMEAIVMVVTADPFSTDVSRFLKENNIKYLRKPFELMRFKQEVLEKLAGLY